MMNDHYHSRLYMQTTRRGERTRRHDMIVEHDPDSLAENCPVAVTITEGWGTPTVYCELTADEARQFAKMLCDAADEAQKVLEER